MNSTNSNELLDQLERQVESHLKEAILSFQNLNEKKLLEQAPNGGWSVTQCLEHLNRYGNYYLPAIQKALVKDFPSTGQFKSSWLGAYFTKMMNPDTGKKKIKTFKEYSPSSNLNAPAVVAEFIQQQELLLQLVRQARSKNLNKIKIAISISKWIKLSLGDVLSFVIAHDERHIRQAKRLLMNEATSTGNLAPVLSYI